MTSKYLDPFWYSELMRDSMLRKLSAKPLLQLANHIFFILFLIPYGIPYALSLVSANPIYWWHVAVIAVLLLLLILMPLFYLFLPFIRKRIKSTLWDELDELVTSGTFTRGPGGVGSIVFIYSTYIAGCALIGAVNVLYVIFSIATVFLLILSGVAGHQFSSQMLDVLARSAAVFVGVVVCVLLAKIEPRK